MNRSSEALVDAGIIRVRVDGIGIGSPMGYLAFCLDAKTVVSLVRAAFRLPHLRSLPYAAFVTFLRSYLSTIGPCREWNP